MNRSGQGALEFTIITVAMLIAFAGLFLFMEYQFEKAQQSREAALVEQVIGFFESEIEIAAIAGEGYERVFYVPQTIIGIPYELYINQNQTEDGKDEFVLEYKNTAYLRFLAHDINGSFSFGEPLEKGYFCIQSGEVVQITELQTSTECPE